MSTDTFSIARDNYTRFKRAYDLTKHTEYLQRSEKGDRFYRGDQWDPKVKKQVESEGRPALTFNKILPTINTLIGEQIQRRLSVQFKSEDPAEAESAAAMTKLALCELNKQQYFRKESQMFQDGAIADGRGYLDMRMDFNVNPEGELSLECEDPRSVIPDPEARDYDPQKWDEVYTSRWQHIDALEVQWGKEVTDEIRARCNNGTFFGSDSVAFTTYGYNDLANDKVALDDAKDKGSYVSKVRVIERQFYKSIMAYSVLDPETGTVRQLPSGYDQKTAQMFAQQHGLFLMRKLERRPWWRITADATVLVDDWMPYRSFTIIPFFCYFRPGNPFGAVSNLLDPQEHLNKLKSQELHIVNSTANSGWVVEENSLGGGMTTSDLSKSGAKSGLVLVYKPGRQAPQKIQPNTIPSGIDRMGQYVENSILDISGLRTLQGLESAEISGVVLEQKESRGQIQVSVIMDNLNFTRWLVGRKLLELFQDFYTDHRIFKYTDPVTNEESVEQINAPMPDGSVQNEVSRGKFDLIISTMPAREMFEEQQFAQAVNLRNIGVAIPDYRIVKYSHLADKDSLSDELQQLAGLADPTEEEIQAQEQQRQLTLQTQMLEIQRLEGEIAEMYAGIEEKIQNAKIKGETHEFNFAKLQEELRMRREELMTRRELAQLAAMSRLDTVALQNKGNIMNNIISKKLDRGNHVQR